jgi:hypothetical protein
MDPSGQGGLGTTTFMAECFWPGVSVENVADTGERVRQAAEALGRSGSLARYLGAILVPTDEIALLLVEAVSLDAAGELARQAAVPSERVLEIVRLGAFLPGPSRQPRSSSKEPR